MNSIPFRRSPLALALFFALPALAAEQAQDSGEHLLDSVVITAPAMVEPLTIVTDPKAPRQPIPANDGADFLKSIPGFSVIRKGGTDGDPLLRGMSGSRLGIFLDGQEIYGGCGGRMDPPTAYVYPAAYDRVTVVKGPQNVIYGAGTSAGAVLFERDLRRFEASGWMLDASLIGGSFGRNDQIADIRGGTPEVQVRAGATRGHSDDYEDGDGTKIHSRYTRWSTNAALAWTPDEWTSLELSAARSDGEAAYADRGMDGSKFARDNFGLKFERRNLSPVVEKVWAQAYYNHIDHVMDNYSLRDQPKPNGFAVSNPDRFTTGARAGVTLALSEPLRLTVGADTKRDIHRGRSASGRASADEAEGVLHSLPYTEDVRFEQYGVFGEASYRYQDGSRTVAGLRVDQHSAKDERPCASGVCPNPTRGDKDRATLNSGFARYEGAFDAGAGIWYAGIGHVERFPDFWERIRFDENTLSSAFMSVDPEKTTQLDVGLNWSDADWSTAVSAFYGKVNDYVLMKWTAPVRVRNVDATVFGAELDLARRLARNWKATGTLAWVRGENDTDDVPLAQQPPLEVRLALEYDDGVFSFGNLLRLVADQNRYDIGSGNIVANGQDIGRTPGFAVFSVNAGWRPKKGVLVSAGIDNLFDRTYAEHLSKGGAMVPGYAPPGETRINEPGRVFWLQARVTLD